MPACHALANPVAPQLDRIGDTGLAGKLGR